MSEMVLYHHGIKGQKWGIRRFQNEDGSLTEAGKKRLAKEDLKRHGGEYQKAKKTFDKNDAIAKGDISGALKNVEQFSNQELKELADRKRAINDVMGLDASRDFNKGKLMSGIKMTSDALKTLGDFTTNSINLWNNAAKISNALFGTKLKKIGDSEKKNKDTVSTKVISQRVLDNGMIETTTETTRTNSDGTKSVERETSTKINPLAKK